MAVQIVAWVNPATLLDNTDADNAALLAQVVGEIANSYPTIIVARITVTADEEDDGTLPGETDDLLGDGWKPEPSPPTAG